MMLTLLATSTEAGAVGVALRVKRLEIGLLDRIPNSDWVFEDELRADSDTADRFAHHPITAGAIDYSLPQGSVADEICYWRDMTLVPHLLNLFTKANIESTLSLARFEPRDADRKQLALELRREIICLRS